MLLLRPIVTYPPQSLHLPGTPQDILTLVILGHILPSSCDPGYMGPYVLQTSTLLPRHGSRTILPLFWDRTSLNYPGWPWTHSGTQIDLEVMILESQLESSCGDRPMGAGKLEPVLLCSAFWSSVLTSVMTAAIRRRSLGWAAWQPPWHLSPSRHGVEVKNVCTTGQWKNDSVRRALLFREWH